jgi:hypothetical protein
MFDRIVIWTYFSIGILLIAIVAYAYVQTL